MRNEFRESVKYLEEQFNKYDENDHSCKIEVFDLLEDISFAARDLLEKSMELIGWGEV